ncbi:MAG: Gfo/Idh/MocA family oxidoreductase [Gemmatimonadetes bacterium]|nr:Gfo/Idh/MocA family oxidoreductase [Gemmatimonadota bacterium]
MSRKPLGIGIVGSGYNARAHIQAFTAVRDAEIRGVWSPHRRHREDAAALARDLDLGDTRAHRSVAAMVADRAVDAIWLCGPNHTRVQNVEEIVDTLGRGRGELRGLACEKPLARNVAEAKRLLELTRRVRLRTGYLENQVFAPQVEHGRQLVWARGAAVTGRPYLARAAEEHNGPHMPWFWQGALQGGGVLNDMMCHSLELVRHLLTAPGAPRRSVRPVRVSAHIASLKWSRPEYARRLSRTMGRDVDYTRHPADDFATATVEYRTADGFTVIGEATTSWSYVGAGLRLSAELLGPEYSMSWNTLDSGLRLFFSREVVGEAGEDLVEKQNAETGMMPVVTNEPGTYGYEAEDRHMVRCFLAGRKPYLTFEDGLETVKLLMTAYRSAEEARTLRFPARGLDGWVPKVARGVWKG